VVLRMRRRDVEIIKIGTVDGLRFQLRLFDDEGNVLARLYGDWVLPYKGKRLGIVALDEEGEPFFEIAAKILNPKEEEHEVAISDPLHNQELEERDEQV